MPLPCKMRPMATSSHCRAPFQPALPVCQPRRSVAARSTGWADGAAVRAEEAMFGKDFGARDATAGELESNFADKVIGNWDTAHIIKVPAAMKSVIGLTAQSCVPVEEATLLEEKDTDLLKQQIPGWKIGTNSAGHQSVRMEWRVKSVDAAAQLQAMVSSVGQAAGHPVHVTVSGDIVIAELSTPQKGGLTLNDFVVAAKVNELDIKPLLPPPRKRYWA